MATRIRREPTLLWIFRVAAVLIGLLHTAIAIQDQSMNEDGISYLDLGEAYLAGHWWPVNSVWSPLYPLVLGAALRAFRPSLHWEFTVVHLVNFAIYLLALVCFDCFWRRTRRALEAAAESEGGAAILPGWAWWAIGYALFVWSSVVLIRFRAVTPDMLVAALVYLAAGLLVRIAAEPPRTATHALFGGVLGLAYLTKAVMFPLGLVFLGASALLTVKRVGGARAWLLGALGFAVIAGPMVTALSVEKQRLTFGEVGRLTYMRYVNRMPYPHWPADAPHGLGTPDHPARRIHDDPTVYEFRAPVRGTYPLSYDPSYFFDGVTSRPDLAGQARRLEVSVKFYLDLFVREQGAMLGALLMLLGMSAGALRRGSWRGWPLALLVTGSAGLAIYVPVYVEGRYLAPFIVLLWAGLLALIRLEAVPLARATLRFAGAALPLLVLLQLALFDSRYVSRIGPLLAGKTAAPGGSPPWQLAETLLAAGVRPGDEIGFIGYAFGASFARLARVRITSDMPSGEAVKFWSAPRETRDAVLAAFAGAGATAIVTDELPPGPVPEGWTPIPGRRGYGYRLLERRTTGSPRLTRGEAPPPAAARSGPGR